MIGKENKVLSVCSWIHSVLLFAGCYLLFPAIGQIEGRTAGQGILEAGFLFLPVVISFYMLRKVKNLLLYLLGTGAVTAVIWFMTKNIMTTVFTVLIFLIRCYTRIEKGRIRKQMRDFPGETGRFYEPEMWEIPVFLDQPILLHWLIFLIEYIGLIFVPRHDYLPAMFMLFLAEICVTFVYRYVFQMQQYVLGKQQIANLPSATILRNGYAVFAVMMIGLCLFAAPAILYGKEPLTALYHEAGPIEVLPEQLQAENTGEGDGMMEMIGLIAEEASEPPAWMEFLSKGIMAVMMTGISVFAVAGILKTVKKLTSRFADGDEDEVIDLTLIEEERKQMKKQRKKEEREKRLSPEFRIRKKYKKQILRLRKTLPGISETPMEIEQRTDLGRIPDPDLFHSLYEKARYSREGCTSEEVQKFPG